MTEIGILERIAGAMLGLACGDALGAPAEYRSRDFIRQKWGRLTEMTGGGIWAPGEWTDDTGMTLCVAQGILDSPEDPVEPIGERFLDWAKSAKDVGDTVASVLDSYAGDWSKASRLSPAARSGRAAGNGSLMRTLPVALAYPKTWEMLTASARVSALTHWDPQAETACAVYCLWIEGILQGKTLRTSWFDAVESARKVAAYGLLDPSTPGPVPLPEALNDAGEPDDEEQTRRGVMDQTSRLRGGMDQTSRLFWARLTDVESLTYDDLQPTGYAGYVVDCLEAVVWCCLNALEAEEAIENAVNLGGESDTIGAIVGGVAGAYWGVRALPTRWTVNLLARDRITSIAKQLDELRRHHVVYATPGLPPFDYYRVAENLHAGREPLTARDIRLLAASGVTHVIDLRAEQDWSEGRLGSEAVAMIRELGLRRANLPAVDIDVFDAVHRYLSATMANPDAHAYVHGASGRRRTIVVLAAYLAAESLMTYDEVIDHLADQLMKSAGIKIDPDEELAAKAREWLQIRLPHPTAL